MLKKVQNQTPVLHLNLKSKWFEMILNGEKTEEYREIKPYWSRILTPYIKIKGKSYHPTDVNICFSNGYSKDRKQIIMECSGLFIREGNSEWGATPGETYYVLTLGKTIRKAAND